jgi:prepilin-type N-terminal cleavage/methylation domain-containing protein
MKIGEKGFTLFELLIAVAVAAIVGAFALLFFNPGEQLAQGRNNQRISHINTIADAVKTRVIEYRGAFQTNCLSGSLPTSTRQIGSGAGNYNLEPCVVPNYLTVMPLDPQVGTTTAIGYNISYSTSTMQVTIGAPNAELGQTISVTR